VRIPARLGLLIALPAALVAAAGLATGAVATSPTTTIAATTTLPPVDLFGGVRWIQAAFASPCSDGTVQMSGGSAIDNGAMAVIEDVLPLDVDAGLAVAFLTCHAADGSTTESAAVLVRVGATGLVESLVEQSLGAHATVIDVQLPSFTVESPEGPPLDGSCCAPFVRRRSFTVGLDGFQATEESQRAAFNQTVLVAPLVGGDGDLIRASVSAPALCYRWDNVYLAVQDPGDELVVAEPSPELQTVRLALIYVTGQWITPTSQMSQQMSSVAAAYQEARGIAVDGLIGDETTSALAIDLGCPGGGSFNQVMPPALGPRRFASVPDLLVATQQYVAGGTSGSPSLDALLAAARWDGANALFLGCHRWEVPVTGMSCNWSGTTPLQLIGLVDDATLPGIGSFSILYGRSAPVEVIASAATARVGVRPR